MWYAGPKGAKAKELEKESGARIKFDMSNGTGEVVIRGNP